MYPVSEEPLFLDKDIIQLIDIIYIRKYNHGKNRILSIAASGGMVK